MRIIYLEFKHENGAIAANGTDITFHIDGRWGSERINWEIEERVYELRQQLTKYRDQLFVGYTHSQLPFANRSGGAIHFRRDLDPPEWAQGKCVACYPEPCQYPTSSVHKYYTV